LRDLDGCALGLSQCALIVRREKSRRRSPIFTNRSQNRRRGDALPCSTPPEVVGRRRRKYRSKSELFGHEAISACNDRRRHYMMRATNSCAGENMNTFRLAVGRLSCRILACPFFSGLSRPQPASSGCTASSSRFRTWTARKLSIATGWVSEAWVLVAPLNTRRPSMPSPWPPRSSDDPNRAAQYENGYQQFEGATENAPAYPAPSWSTPIGSKTTVFQLLERRLA